MNTSDIPQPDPHEEELIEEERQRRIYKAKKRKAREAAGEIRELNITAMMDMMTILLVFLLKSFSASSTTVQMTDDLQVPRTSATQKPQEAINITVSAADIAVNDKKTNDVVGGDIPASYRDETNNMLVIPLLALLEKEVEKQKYIAKYNSAAPFEGKVNIIADKRLPYRTILAVLYTAGQAELRQYKMLALGAAE